MCEPAELTRLRETLSRSHAIEAFRHLREHDPADDEELEEFIKEYVRDAYADGVEDWSASEYVVPAFRRSIDAPLGKKLRQAGFESLWDYVSSRGFDELEVLKADLDFLTIHS